ncbi:hypothetical protein CR969_00935 [Candidatus Saccharibacteria bacterium]|nr:MAG: hypothetical protein CR969_00935 [Candidatus Saccharibacteria bacterium]
MNWIKNHRILSSFVLLFCLGLYILFFQTWLISGAWNLSLGALNIEQCQPEEEFYVNEQAIEVDDWLEGKIKHIQDKKPGRKQDCWSYKTRETYSRIIKPATPSIVKVGTRKFKDPKLMSLIPDTGIRSLTYKEPVSVYYVNNYSDFVWMDGRYNDYKKAITVKRSIPRSEQATIFAHEYLHYVWYRDKLDDDIKLVGDLNTFYKSNPHLQQRMKEYTPEMTKPTEFFSYSCTEFSDSYLTPYIISKCNQYINRSKLYMSY